jgi:hypothetical protein
MSERWRDIPGYEGYYQVSDCGRVRRLSGRIKNRHWTGRIIRPGYAGRERCYAFVRLSQDGTARNWYVHDLVLLAFVGSKPAGLEVCHGAEGKSNNHLTNLSYGTPAKNQGPDRRRDGTSNCVAVRRSDGSIFSSLTEAARFSGLKSHTPISNVLSGRQQTAGGFFWEFINA